MKQLIYLILICMNIIPCMHSMEQDVDSEQEKEEKSVPSLKELAARAVPSSQLHKAAQSLHSDIVIPLIERSTLGDLMNIVTAIASVGDTSPLLASIEDQDKFVKNDMKEKEQAAKVKIPDAFFNAFINNQITVESFVTWINSLPSTTRSSIISAFAHRISAYMNADSIVRYSFNYGDSSEYVIPVDFDIDNNNKIKSNMDIILSPDYLIPLFIGQQIQQYLESGIEKVRDTATRPVQLRMLQIDKSPIFNRLTLKDIDNCIERVEYFVQKQTVYLQLIGYYKKLRDFVRNLPNILETRGNWHMSKGKYSQR